MCDYEINCNHCYWREVRECDESELCNGFQPNEATDYLLTEQIIERGRVEFREEWLERMEEWMEEYQ